MVYYLVYALLNLSSHWLTKPCFRIPLKLVLGGENCCTFICSHEKSQ